MLKAISILLISVLLPSLALASEPAFCTAKNFQKLEFAIDQTGLERAHVYQVGHLKLAGLAIGDSKVAKVEALSLKYADDETQKYCTFYFNDGNADAAKAFTWLPLPNPIWAASNNAVHEFDRIVTPAFSDLLSCAHGAQYVAIGCDGMKHRGPSVFSMLLAYAGCSPKSATEIITSIWGMNFVSTETREQIAEIGYQLGNSDPIGRKNLQALMGVSL